MSGERVRVTVHLESRTTTESKGTYHATITHPDGSTYTTARRFRTAISAINAAMRHEWSDPEERARVAAVAKVEWS